MSYVGDLAEALEFKGDCRCKDCIAQAAVNAIAALADETGVRLTCGVATEAMMNAAVERTDDQETIGFYDGIFAAMHDAAPAIPEGCSDD